MGVRIDYHLHHGRLPLGERAVFVRGTIGPLLLFLFAAVILLFPDGRLTRPWKWVLWLYLGVRAAWPRRVSLLDVGGVLWWC